MSRLGSCIVLLLTLACPVLCQLDHARIGERAPVDAGCSCTPGPSDPQPEKDPCDGSNCFCSPYVLREHRPSDEAATQAWVPDVVVAWLDAAVASTVDEYGRRSALLFKSPPSFCKFIQSLPLLI